MQDNRSPGDPLRVASPPRPGWVQGWGVCDVLRAELDPVQVESCIDELCELTNVYLESVGHPRGVAPEAVREDETDRSAYNVRVLAAMRDHVDSDAPVLVGPAPLVLQIIAGATTNAVQNLAELVGHRRLATAADRSQLIDRALVASAWVRTLCDSEALQWFSFDPQVDPTRPWTD